MLILLNIEEFYEARPHRYQNFERTSE
jgi:hypothetical protein